MKNLLTVFFFAIISYQNLSALSVNPNPEIELEGTIEIRKIRTIVCIKAPCELPFKNEKTQVVIHPSSSPSTAPSIQENKIHPSNTFETMIEQESNEVHIEKNESAKFTNSNEMNHGSLVKIKGQFNQENKLVNVTILEVLNR